MVTDVLIGPPPQLAELTVKRDIRRTKVILGSPYTYNLSVAKTFHLQEGVNLSTQVGWSYRGRRFDDLSAIAASRVDPYGLLDARITLNWHSLSASLWGTNLRDQKVIAAGGATTTTVFKDIYYGPPREVGLELTYNFGGGK